MEIKGTKNNQETEWMEFNDSEMLSLEIAAMEKIYKSPSFYPKSLD